MPWPSPETRAAARSPSLCRNQPSSWFQLPQFRLADAAQIYRTLKRLEAKKLLKSVSAASDKGPDRRVYTRTRAVIVLCSAGSPAAPCSAPNASPYLAQVFFLGQAADLALSDRFLAGVRETIAARLAALEAFEAERSRAPGYPDGWTCWPSVCGAARRC